jgi:hypothetical protein
LAGLIILPALKPSCGIHALNFISIGVTEAVQASFLFLEKLVNQVRAILNSKSPLLVKH